MEYIMENLNKEFKVNKKIEKFSKTLGITGKTFFIIMILLIIIFITGLIW